MTTGYAETAPSWQPERPRLRPVRVLLAWLVAAVALMVSAAVVPGVSIQTLGGAIAVAAVLAVINAVVAPLVAALHLPFTVLIGFVVLLFVTAAGLFIAARVTDNAIEVDSFGWALLMGLVTAAVTMVLNVIMGVDDDDEYTFRVIQRIARRQGGAERTDVPGIVFLEIDGLALPVLRRAVRDGNVPTMARWLAEGTHFAKGSMAPKIQAVVWYLEAGGTRALITNIENIGRALRGETGTWVTRS